MEETRFEKEMEEKRRFFVYLHETQKFGKRSQLHSKLHIQKKNTKGHSNIVSSNKRDPIQISYVVFGQLQVYFLLFHNLFCQFVNFPFFPETLYD